MITLIPLNPRCKKLILRGFFAATTAGLLLCLSVVGVAATLEEAHLEDEAKHHVDLTWEEASRRTLEKNPGLIASNYQMAAQAGRVQQAGLKPNPELSLTVEDAFGTGDYSSFDKAETTFGVSWALEGAARRARVNSANARTSMLEVEQDICRLDAVAATASMYVTVLALQSRLDQTDQAADLARATVSAIDTRVKAGRAPDAEVARAKVDLSRRLLEHEDVEHELRVARRQLAAQWGAREVDFDKVMG
ncbi:MAG: hypothetical protein EOO68_13875, partial [Moraxellaceae bacterium]